MELTMNDYQEKAMTTCLPSCNNMVYALTELNAEVGEFNDKVAKWVEKCREESRKPNTKVVMLIPARTDTLWFHRHIYNKAEIRFIKGRLKFGQSNCSAPFPSMVVIF